MGFKIILIQEYWGYPILLKFSNTGEEFQRFCRHFNSHFSYSVLILVTFGGQKSNPGTRAGRQKTLRPAFFPLDGFFYDLR